MNSPYKFTDPLGLTSVLNQRYSYSEGLGAGGGALSGALASGMGLSLFDSISGGYSPPSEPAEGHEVSGTSDAPQTDSRPYIADMVSNNGGIDKRRYPASEGDPWRDNPGRYRFGLNHDGEHILGASTGSIVSAIAGLTGTVLTYYSQGDGTFAIFVLLKNSNIVMVLKDFASLDPKITRAPFTSPGNSKLFNKSGTPISRVNLETGDVIGKTGTWTGKTNGGSVGLHFGFVIRASVEKYRAELGNQRKYSSSIVERHPEFFIVPCSAASPARC